MTEIDSEGNPRHFSEKDRSSCRIETAGGTVYWLSEADPEGYRWIVREQLQRSDTETMILQNVRSSREAVDLGDKFRARVIGDVQQGKPFVIEAKRNDTRIFTESVVGIEIGKVPDMVFG